MTAGIDLSVGATLGLLGDARLASSMQHMLGAHDGSAEVAIVGVAVMLASGAAVGLLNGLLITRLKLPPFIVTLGTLTAITGATDLLNNATEITTLPNFVTNLGTDSVLNGWLPLPGADQPHHRDPLRADPRAHPLRAAHVRDRLQRDRHPPRRRPRRPPPRVGLRRSPACWRAVAGLMVTANFSAASPVAGQNDELYAIAAVVIGGASHLRRPRDDLRDGDRHRDPVDPHHRASC